ncbi:MAG: excinuclease ABC subunit A [Chloroflexi bacterium HGW-Chloroflexi-10]|nr:MAG: excinuclease ABC subunit A [Chloroflexi bacterium HGW-Chloroflexi-10]
MENNIIVENAKLHNLKNISLSIPKNQLVVFTGLSGSGKSTLVFDTIHKEGQRQYLESLGRVTDDLIKPAVDRIRGLSPSISLDQHLTNRSPRSTVGTATEVFTYLRVLFARVGHRPCPHCGADVPPPYEHYQEKDWQPEENENEWDENDRLITCSNCGFHLPELGMADFSFNKPAGACSTCTGIGEVFTARQDKLINLEKCILEEDAIWGWDIHMVKHHQKTLNACAKHYGFNFDPRIAIGLQPQFIQDLLFFGVESEAFKAQFPGIEMPVYAYQGHFEGVATNLLRRYAEHVHDSEYREKLEELMRTQTCPDCGGSRLKKASRLVSVCGKGIVEVSRMQLTQLLDWIKDLHHSISGGEQEIITVIAIDLQERLQRLVDVGVGYLTLERATPSLSGGEAQRLRLASLLGSGLTGVLYVLDEPTIGLHPRDTQRLLGFLEKLRDLGNTVLVIEHDPEVLKRADYLVDIGPGAGKHGGMVMAAGTPTEVINTPDSITGGYLSGRLQVKSTGNKRSPNGKEIQIIGACENNLKNLDIQIPLGRLVAVTGVSGSGKSSLIFDILDRAAQLRFHRSETKVGKHAQILGWQYLDKVITVDQTSIGRVPRSNAATYTETFNAIREVFAATSAAKQRRLKPGHFSFNTPGGRCERCKGSGTMTVKMHFLPDLAVRCPACKGSRYKADVLAVTYRGKSISQVLEMTIAEALELFHDLPAATERLALLVEVGLGYLQLGQPATTLSGGEAQRVKLARELSRKATGKTLFLLDEPSTGLHMDDTARLIRLLQRLVDSGNSVVVVEHNLDIIRCADWVIDLGPEGGDVGGYLVAQGAPEEISKVEESYTGQFLR